MNQNDMERYYWRTGQRWSGDDRPFKMPRAGLKVAKGTIFLLYAVFVVTAAMRVCPLKAGSYLEFGYFVSTEAPASD